MNELIDRRATFGEGRHGWKLTTRILSSRKAGMFFPVFSGEASHVSPTHTSTILWFGRFWQLHPGNSANSAQDAPFSAQVLVVVIAFFPQQMAFRTLLPLLTLLLVALLGPAFTGAALRAAGFGAPRSSRVPRAADASMLTPFGPVVTYAKAGRMDGEGGEVIRSTQYDAKGL